MSKSCGNRMVWRAEREQNLFGVKMGMPGPQEYETVGDEGNFRQKVWASAMQAFGN